jgi:hypothetical protein
LGLALAVAVAGWAFVIARSVGTRPGVRYLVLFAMVLVGSVPLSVVLTLLLFPLWRWLEATYCIESVGHSGPAEWCYLVTFLASVVISSCAGIVVMRRRLASGDVA